MQKFGPRKGLTGPIEYPNGRVLYIDKMTGEYWDPTTDFYLSDDEVNEVKLSLLNLLKD